VRPPKPHDQTFSSTGLDNSSSVKALRYYEDCGLLRPARRSNGYRDYSEDEIRLTAEIRVLTSLGLTTQETRPFLDCLRAGHNVGDDCPESLAAYQHKIDGLDGLISQLTSTRDVLVEQLHTAAPRVPVLPNRGDAPDAARRRRSAR